MDAIHANVPLSERRICKAIWVRHPRNSCRNPNWAVPYARWQSSNQFRRTNVGFVSGVRVRRMWRFQCGKILEMIHGQSIHGVELVFLLLLLFVVVFAALARKLETPYPIVLVIGGLLLGFIPGIPKLTLNPDLVFLVVLPPLLYYGAWKTNWRDFKYNLVSILFLAFGLVGFTVLGVAETSRWVFAGFDWQLGFVLGAVVATTDAIAATAIAKHVGLPQRIVDVLEGESLVNDATGLLALEFGIAMVWNGATPTVWSGFSRLVWLIGAGLVLGLLIGLVVEWFENRIDDGPIEIVVSILVPYATYLGANAAHASGVLAVIACGLYLSRKSSHYFSPSVRMQAGAVWESLTFVLNGLVFVLIGLQLPYVLAGIRGYSLRQLVYYGLFFSVLVIALRLLWIFPGAYSAYFIRRHVFHQNEPSPGARGIFVVGWTGMRGVLALAAAISLPEMLEDGSAFPQRNLIIFMTFCVILVTLVLQGLTLPPLIRALGLSGADGGNREEQDARRKILEAAVVWLDTALAKTDKTDAAVYKELSRMYRKRLDNLHQRADAESEETHDAHVALRDRRIEATRNVLKVERETALGLRNEGEINDEVLRHIEYELDLSETRLSAIR
jgi:monovalent cation/hydrogen antiporter